MQLTMSEIIERPIDDVFRYVTDVDRIPEWIGVAVSREKLTDGPMGPGTRIRAVDKFMGRQMEYQEEIVSFEPPKNWALRMSGAMQGEVRGRLHEVGGATSLTVDFDVQPSGFAQRVLSPIFRMVMRRAVEGDLARLKARLEGGGGGAAA